MTDRVGIPSRTLHFETLSGDNVKVKVQLPEWLIDYAERAADNRGREYVLHVYLAGVGAGLVLQSDAPTLELMEAMDGLPRDQRYIPPEAFDPKL